MGSHIELACTVHFENLNRFLADQIKDLKVNEKLTLHKVVVEGEGKYLTIHAFVSGVYEGEVEITCIPEWIRDEQRFDLKELDVRLVSRNILAKGANWMANHIFANKLDKLGEQILNKEIGELMKKGIGEFEAYPLPTGGVFKADSVHFDLRDLHAVGEVLHLQLVIDAKTQIVF